jgi:hypothetical protein
VLGIEWGTLGRAADIGLGDIVISEPIGIPIRTLGVVMQYNFVEAVKDSSFVCAGP